MGENVPFAVRLSSKEPLRRMGLNIPFADEQAYLGLDQTHSSRGLMKYVPRRDSFDDIFLRPLPPPPRMFFCRSNFL